MDLSVYAGTALGPGQCALIAGAPSGTDTEAPLTAIVRWSSEAGFDGFTVNRYLSRIEALDDDAGTFLCTTPMGAVSLVNGDKLEEELIAERDGPSTHGYICTLRRIGGSIYAAGMGRQVYRRSAPRSWRRIDRGVLDLGENMLEVKGFQSIDGEDENELHAVGYDGEIWFFEGEAWVGVDSPTNLLLQSVRNLGRDTVYACGKAGTLLKGRRDRWEVIEQTLETADFLSMEAFADTIFLAGATGVFRLAPGHELEPIDPHLHGSARFRTLSSCRGALWAFGPQNMAWTVDGDRWHEVPFDLKP